jgi:hypothetical protein
MRARIQFTITFPLPLLLGSVGLGAPDQGAEPEKFFREYVGLGDDQIQAIGTATRWRRSWIRELPMRFLSSVP